METNFEMFNMVTGEGLACHLDSQTIKKVRGTLRQWLKAGMPHHQLYVNNASDSTIYRYFRRYCYGESIGECDTCRTPMQRKHINYLEDSYGVCIIALCNNCNR